MKILWIEDDFGLDETLGDWLRFEENHEVLHAIGPKEGLAKLRDNLDALDLILLDIMMPPDGVVDEVRSDYGKDTGLLLIEKINHLTSRKVPIVILSARQDELGPMSADPAVVVRLEKTIGLASIVEGIRKVPGASAAGA